MQPRGYVDQSQGYYDTAEICANGHVITSALGHNPGMHVKYCSTCGSPTTSICDKCGESIRGRYYRPHGSTLSHYDVPRYCHNCGEPYKWTEAQIKKTNKYVNALEISVSDKTIVKESLQAIGHDNEEAENAAGRLTAVMAKYAKPVGDAIRSFAVDVASDTAKKIITKT